MKKMLLLLILIFAFSALKAQNKIPRLYKKSVPAIVKLYILRNDGTSGEGTGFFVDEKTIVTCYHVVENVSSIKIETQNGKLFTADSVITSNKEADLMKFTIKEKSDFWLKLSNKTPLIGSNVYTISNPDDYDFTMSNGIVSAIRMNKKVQIIQNTAPCSSGSSGAPLFDKRGIVVGVVSHVKFIGQNLNFAISSIEANKINDDNSITNFQKFSDSKSDFQIDSTLSLANYYFDRKDYSNSLSTVVSLSKYVKDSTRFIEITRIMADCYLFQQNYSLALQYNNRLIQLINSLTIKTLNNNYIMAESLFKKSVCAFALNDQRNAITIVEKSIDYCLIGLENDTLRKKMYTELIQEVYASDALFKHAVDRIYDACLSWKLAKEYGYTKDDYGLDNICK